MTAVSTVSAPVPTRSAAGPSRGGGGGDFAALLAGLGGTPEGSATGGCAAGAEPEADTGEQVPPEAAVVALSGTAVVPVLHLGLTLATALAAEPVVPAEESHLAGPAGPVLEPAPAGPAVDVVVARPATDAAGAPGSTGGGAGAHPVLPAGPAGLPADAATGEDTAGRPVVGLPPDAAAPAQAQDAGAAPAVLATRPTVVPPSSDTPDISDVPPARPTAAEPAPAPAPADGDAAPATPAAGALPAAPVGVPGAEAAVTAVDGRTPVDAAEPAAPAAPAAPPPAPPADQLVTVLAPLLEGPDGAWSVSLQLYPEELGTVQLEVAMRAGEISVQLHTADRAAQDVLRAALPDLRAQLESTGLTTSGMTVDGRAPGGGTGTPRRDPPQQAGDGPAGPDEPPALPDTDPDAVLDVRI